MEEIKLINDAVCREFSIEEKSLSEERKPTEKVKLARFAQILMFYKHCTKNYNELSVMIKRNSHSRAIERLSNANWRYSNDPIFKRRVDRIDNNLGI